jgi:hypothetical protein
MRPAETLRGEPRPTGENATPAHGRPQHIRVPGKRINRGGRALAFEEKDDFALADKDVVTLDPQLLDVERRPLVDKPSRFLDTAAPDRHNDSDTCSGRMFSTEVSKEISELADEAHPAERADQHTLAGMALENDRLVAVDPFTGSAADLDGRELVEWNPQALRSARPVQHERMIAELEPAARARALGGAPDDSVVVRACASFLGRQTCSAPNV